MIVVQVREQSPLRTKFELFMLKMAERSSDKKTNVHKLLREETKVYNDKNPLVNSLKNAGTSIFFNFLQFGIFNMSVCKSQACCEPNLKV